jgi:hypothetical protein
MNTEEKFEGWAILELMGHRRLGGYVRETQIAGAGMLRIDIPSNEPQTLIVRYPRLMTADAIDRVKIDVAASAAKAGMTLLIFADDVDTITHEIKDPSGITQFYPPSSLYGLTPVTEAMARAVAKNNMPQPVSRWELPQLPQPTLDPEQLAREAMAGLDDPDDDHREADDLDDEDDIL